MVAAVEWCSSTTTGDRHTYCKVRSVPRFAFDCDLAAHQFAEAARDGEAEAAFGVALWT
jgi:hypothetical protein